MNVRILLLALVMCLCGKLLFSQASLPTYCTAFNAALPTGWSCNNPNTDPTHDDCNGKALRFNAVSHVLTIQYSTAATNVKYSISRNGNQNKTLLVQESANGTTWSTVKTWTQSNTPTSATPQNHSLNAASRYVRFAMTVRDGGKMEVDIVQIYNGTPAAAAASCKMLPLDCVNGIPLCSDQTLSGNSNDFGAQELGSGNRGCLEENEHQSSWYYFSPITSGTLQFTITPSATVDYDFAIWNGTCASLGNPVRCSYSAEKAPTGLSNVSESSEDEWGDGYVKQLNINVGQTYIILIDNYTADNTAFTFDLTLTNGATLNCNPAPLPVELVSFTGEDRQKYNLLAWSTYSEEDNDFFTLERSTDGVNWQIIHEHPGAGTSTELLHYSYEDYDFSRNAVNYYRLSQTDFNGKRKTFDVISVDNSSNQNTGPVRVVNLIGQEVPANTHGVLIQVYEDGTSRLILKE